MDAGTLGVGLGAMALLIPIVAIVGGIAVAIAAIFAKSRVRQLEIQERIAMIEKGLVPAPEQNPAGFERALAHMERRRGSSPSRHRRAGIVLIAVGVGVGILIGIAGEEPRSALGIGGMLVAFGCGFLLMSHFERDEHPPIQEPPTS